MAQAEEEVCYFQTQEGEVTMNKKLRGMQPAVGKGDMPGGGMGKMKKKGKKKMKK